MKEPAWLTTARAEGRILHEATARPAERSPQVVVPLPPSTNHLFHNGRGRSRVKTEAYKAWQKEAWPLLAELATPTDYPVEVCIVVLPGKEGWTAACDVANREKALVDGLVSAGVLPEDNTAYVCGVRLGLSPMSQAERSYVLVYFQARQEWWRDFLLAENL